ncbi:hypothetical protein [Leptothoe sp. PORK10 BA2]|uniref:hypothetical protein n=1 Tax=Leptothoe sp. PORK10 BA2 TaxID=3110254 RepID=UPI002B1F7D52|nr:hypothetical protein [Leptothoe sp. PORK10 BA2]MEA5464030.1 hypothetical protein [Leptothoe sp. PORK10 BA2]
MGAVVNCTYSTTVKQNNSPKTTKVPILTRVINLPIKFPIKISTYFLLRDFGARDAGNHWLGIGQNGTHLRLDSSQLEINLEFNGCG